MTTCKECGATITEDMKFCNKCGADVATVSSDETNNYSEQSSADAGNTVHQSIGSDLLDSVASVVPPNLMKKGNKTMHLIGLASMATLALVYLICFFVFLADICLPVGFGSEAAGAIGGASVIWLLIFFAYNLAPIVFTVLALINKKYKLWCVFAAATIILLTFFAFFAWLICTPDSLLQAVAYYGGPNNLYAWYVMLDAASEIWYIKILLASGVIFGFGIDYLANKNK